MGYACPVCADPQADAGHLANHLGFTAILGEESHEAWLDEHAPDWGEMGEDELADVVVESVEETEFPQVFEDTVGGLAESTPDALEERSGALFDDEGHGHDHERGEDHGHGHDHPVDPTRGSTTSSGDVDPETEAVLEEARELTREMYADEDDGESDENE